MSLPRTKPPLSQHAASKWPHYTACHSRGAHHALPAQQESSPHFAGIGGALARKVHGSPVALDRPLHRAGLPGDAGSQVCTLAEVLRREQRLLRAQVLLHKVEEAFMKVSYLLVGLQARPPLPA